jgi:ribonuclease HII
VNKLPDYAIENELKQKGFKFVCGVDEAGRGPLAGPVSVAAVILPEGCDIEGLNDSKKISEKKREQLYPIICDKAVAWSVVLVDHEEIDRVNILNATLEGMKKAIESLKIPADYAIIDGNRLPELDIPSNYIIKGDAKSMSIAAASVIAKVTRDRIMTEYDKIYPEYQFAKHKGYGTKLHYEMIKKCGICPIHRKTFLKKILGGM